MTLIDLFKCNAINWSIASEDVVKAMPTQVPSKLAILNCTCWTCSTFIYRIKLNEDNHSSDEWFSSRHSCAWLTLHLLQLFIYSFQYSIENVSHGVVCVTCRHRHAALLQRFRTFLKVITVRLIEIGSLGVENRWLFNYSSSLFWQLTLNSWNLVGNYKEYSLKNWHVS